MEAKVLVHVFVHMPVLPFVAVTIDSQEIPVTIVIGSFLNGTKVSDAIIVLVEVHPMVTHPVVLVDSVLLLVPVIPVAVQRFIMLQLVMDPAKELLILTVLPDCSVISDIIIARIVDTSPLTIGGNLLELALVVDVVVEIRGIVLVLYQVLPVSNKRMVKTILADVLVNCTN